MLGRLEKDDQTESDSAGPSAVESGSCHTFRLLFSIIPSKSVKTDAFECNFPNADSTTGQFNSVLLLVTTKAGDLYVKEFHLILRCT